MTMLKRVGYFQELRHGDATGPSLEEARQTLPRVDEARIVKYLEAGKIYVATAGPSIDVLDPRKPKIASAHVMTDGVYSWPGDLGYYVHRYHVRLPDEFVAHMASNSWVVPQVDVLALQKAEDNKAKWDEQGEDIARRFVKAHLEYDDPEVAAVREAREAAREDADQKSLRAFYVKTGQTQIARHRFERDSLRAHVEWIRRDRQGAGRLAVIGAQASGTDLQAVKLVAARLERIDLRKAILDYADLTDAELSQCTFDLAGINSTHFDNARIVDCRFEDAVGRIVKLERAVVSGSRFDRAKLHTSQWSDANVSATSFANAQLGNATFDRASFVDCDFRGAWLGPITENPTPSMRATRFVNCDFRGADFTRANLDDATFERCKFDGARGEPRSAVNLSVTDADVGGRDQLLTVLEQSLSVDAILEHPGPLVAARDIADPRRTAVFVVDQRARLLTRVPLTDALAGLRQGATYGRSGIVWAWDDDAFTIWDAERKVFEAGGESLSWPAGPIERKLVTSVGSFINPDRRGNRGVKLVMPDSKYGRLVIVQDNDFAADDQSTYTRDDARRDGMWASHVGRDLAAWLGLPHDDEFVPSTSA